MKLRILVAIIFSVLILAVMLWISNPRDVADRLTGIDLKLILLVISLYFMNLLTKGYRWHLLVNSSGKKIKFKKNFLYYIIGLAVNNLTPGKIGGEPIRLYLLKKDERVPAGQTLAAIFSEKVLDITVITTMAIIGVIFILPLLPRSEAWFLLIVLIILIAIIVTSIYLFSHTNVLKKVIDRALNGTLGLSKKSSVKKWADMFSGFIDKFNFGMKEILSARKSATACMGLTLIIWTNEALRLFIIIMALPDAMRVGLGAVFIASSIANILSIIIPLGSGNILGIGAVFIAVGMDSTTASAAGILHVATSLWISVPIGAIALMITGFKLSELNGSVK